MARRRLNKKVALIGSTVFLLLAMGAVFIIFKLNRNPAPFVADGDAAWAAGNYEAARDNYVRAYGLTRAPEQKIDLLFKLADVYQETGEWERVLACWTQIITSDPQNVKALLGQLKYVYLMADGLSRTGRRVSGYWEEVLTQARKTLEVVEAAGLADDERAAWEPALGPVTQSGWDGGAARLGPHLHFVKGRAAFELASAGAATAPAELLKEAESDLQQVREVNPGNPQVYRYLAEVFLAQGEAAASRGSLDQKDAAERRADDILAAGARAAGDTPEAHLQVLARKLAVAQRGGAAVAREQMEALEPQYTDLARRFSAHPQVFDAMAQFYVLYAAYSDSGDAPDRLDRALAAGEQARALAPENVEYAIHAAGYHYRKFSVYGDAPALLKAIERTEAALKLPDAQDTPGPTQYARRIHRFSLCSLLARCCVERILSLPESDPARADLLARAEQAVHEIGQIHGSGENPQVLKWQGMLDLARGDAGRAVRNLYAAYEQIKAASPPDERDASLSYTLATVFAETAEVGAVIEFMGSALTSGIVHMKPEALLDYGDALMRAASYDAVLNAVNSFDERFGENRRSRLLRLRALIAKGHITEAEKALAQMNPDDPDVILAGLDLARTKTDQLAAALRRQEAAEGVPDALRQPGAAPDNGSDIQAMTAQLRQYRQEQTDLVQRLLQVSPDAVEERRIVELCQMLMTEGRTDTAAAVVAAFLKHAPESQHALFYRGLLSEPDPSNCPESRRREIREQAIRTITDPVRRATELGLFYQQNEQLDEAMPQWRSVLDATASQGTQEGAAYLRGEPLSPRRVAVGNLFDIARHREDWQLAGELVATAQGENLDDCGGNLFAARLAFARKEYDRALSYMDECLKQRPIFSYGYMLRGNVKAALGQEHEAIADTRRAAELNPADPLIAKALANALYARNAKLGRNVSSEQQLETRQALEQAIRLDPRDTNLLNVYVELIGDSEPLKALALRQTIQASVPSLNNAVLLGRLATQVALKETDETRKEAFFKMAEAAFEQARQIDPNNQLALESYAEYFRVREQNEKARQLLTQSDDRQLLWRHHFRVGAIDEARRLLEQMYRENDNRIDALKGLILVAEQTSDKGGVQKYSQELVALEDNAVNRLTQLRAYLDVGLVNEAEQRLQSFREKYPDESRILLMEALVAKRQGRLPRALDLTNRYLEDSPENAPAWRLRAEITFLMGNYEQAIRDFRQSRTLQDDPLTAVGLARAYLSTGRDDDAIDELRRVLDQPETPPVARTLLEAVYIKQGRAEALRQLYTDVLAESPDNVFWLNRAGALAISQRRYDQAEELYGKAYRLKQQAATGVDPAKAIRDAQYASAVDGYLRAMLLAAGDRTAPEGAWHPEKLDGVFEEGGKFLDTPYAAVVLYRMAEARKKLGDADGVRDYCRRAMDKAWVSEQLAAEVLMRVYLLLGAEEVSSYCRARLEKDPDSLAANYTMFNLAQIENRYDEAVGYIDTCIRLAGPETDQGVNYLVQKAQLFTVAQRKTSDNTYLERAIEVYESLRAKMPNNSSVLNNLAYLLAQNGRKLTAALEYARTAVEQNPDEANYRDTYGYVLYRNDRHAEAAEALAAAIQQYESRGTVPPEVYEHLGLVNEALGERDKARAAYRRALEAGGNNMPQAARERIGAALERLGGQN